MRGQLRGELGALARELRAEGTPAAGTWAALAAATGRHAVRVAGALLGSRADRLPGAVRRACSLERRGDG